MEKKREEANGFPEPRRNVLADIHLGLASESGLTDAEYVAERSDWIDAAFIGGVCADEKTMEAAVEMVERGRDEFLYDDASEFVRNELMSLSKKCGDDVIPGVNIRSSSIQGLLKVAKVVGEFNGIVEINAHCRQEEMIETGCGHALMRDLDRLKRWIKSVKEETDVRGVGVKTRARVVDDMELARGVEEAGGDFLHVDCMDYRETVNEIVEVCNLFVIANNGVRSREDVVEYLERGADAVSTARGARRKRDIKRLAETVEDCVTENRDLSVSGEGKNEGKSNVHQG